MTHAVVFALGFISGWLLMALRWRWIAHESGDRVDLSAERRTMLLHAQHRQDGGK